jgi:arylsulfatase A-like enzyme
MRLFASAVLAFALAAVSGSARARAQAPARPNILIIVGDDQGYADVGFHCCKDIPTPNLDALAAAGVRCSSGYVSGPYCSPTRSGLLTGRYQQRYGHEFNPGGGAGAAQQGMPVGQTTLADRLKAAGYATGLVGKWHLGGAPQFHPARRGFAEFFGFLGGAHNYFPLKAGAGNPQQRGTDAVDEKEYLTEAYAREAVAFIERHAREPWFLYLAFNAVHTPMHATDKYLKRFEGIADPQRRTYAAMTAALDDAVGAVIAKVRSLGLEDNTLIVYFSDNGGPTMKGTTINGSINLPLRGSKRQTFEGGIRVPFVVAFKGRLPAGRVYDKPVIQLDVHATALAAAGIEIKPEWKLDGVDLMPYLSGKNDAAPHDALYWRFGWMMAIRRGDWKLVEADASGRRLFNLAADIGEARDLSTAHPEKVKELQAAWDAWNAGLVKPLWGSAPRP